MKTLISKLGGWNIVLLYTPFLAIIYYSPFTWLVSVDWQRDEFSYCFFVPFIFLYLIYGKRVAFNKISSRPSWAGFWFVGAGIVLYWLGELAGEFYSIYMSFWLLLVGLCWNHWGWRKLKIVAFPLFFLLTMFPQPNFIFIRMSLKLKLLASQIGVSMLQTFGFSAFREGNIIDLGYTQLQVVDACSGLRYLHSLVVLGLLVAYFSKTAFWKKAAFVISTIPIAVVTNSFRIAMVGILYKYFGASVAEGFFHEFTGWVVFVIAIALFLIEVWIVQKILPERYTNKKSQNISALNRPSKQRLTLKENEFVYQNEQSLGKVFHLPQFFIVSSLLILTILLKTGVEFREKIPTLRPFAEFPTTIGEWTGKSEVMAQHFLDALDLSDYLLINYKNSDLKTVNFYVAYYESQRKGESIHSPATCLPGSGWVYKKSGEEQVVLPGTNQTVTINRALIEKGRAKQLSYYWFSQRGRVLTNAYQLKLSTFLGALTQQRTEGALVRIITPVYSFESPHEADERLKKFIFSVEPVLAQFLPQ